MKIGIITFHCSINYGALLQAKALTIVLENMGHECEIINYRLGQDLISHTNVFEINSNLKTFIKNVIRLTHYEDNKMKLKRFKYFYDNYLPVSRKIYKSFMELDEEKLDYDIYICGSDQIWKPINDEYIDKAFYLGFSSAAKKVKISYAPSFGVKDFPTKLQNEVKELLTDFREISVREYSGVKILKDILNFTVKHVIDPTLLVSKEVWLGYSNKDLSISEDYIVVYAMEKNRLFNECLLKLKKLTKYKTILISVDGIKRVTYCDETLYNVGPSEFLSLINNSKLILTNSFHGTSYSIIFEKPFISIPHSSSNSRILELLTSLGIEHRQIKDSEEINEKFLDLDYSKSKLKLQGLIKNSIEFLEFSCRMEGENEKYN